MTDQGRVGSTALTLGFAGLLPPAANLYPLAFGGGEYLGLSLVFALFYPLLILSFIGGIWWGAAMQRTSGQDRLAQVAVSPSIAALPLLLLAAFSDRVSRVVIATGCAVLLTLLVDRHLLRNGEAPENWMVLRLPLSIGLGGLTIIAGIIAEHRHLVL